MGARRPGTEVGRCPAAASGYAGAGSRQGRRAYGETTDGEGEAVTDGRGGDGPQTFGFLLLPHFSLLAFSSAVEPLRAANRLAGQAPYERSLPTAHRPPIHSPRPPPLRHTT